MAKRNVANKSPWRRILACLSLVALVAALTAVGAATAFAEDGTSLVLGEFQAQEGEGDSAQAVSQGKCSENVAWAIYDDGSMHITGTGTMVGWRFWTDKPNNADSASVTAIVVEQGITKLAPLAFMNSGGDGTPFANVVAVSMPEGMTQVGHLAFAKMTKLEKAFIPSTVESFGFGVFNNCTSLSELFFRGAVAPTLGSDGPYNQSYHGFVCSSSESWDTTSESFSSWMVYVPNPDGEGNVQVAETQVFDYCGYELGTYWNANDAQWNQYFNWQNNFSGGGKLASGVKVYIPVGASGYTGENRSLGWQEAQTTNSGMGFVETSVPTYEAYTAVPNLKLEAITELDDYAVLVGPEYPGAMQNAVAAAVATGKMNIQFAADEEAVASALASAKQDIDQALAAGEPEEPAVDHGKILLQGTWDTNDEATANNSFVLYEDLTLVISKTQTGDGGVYAAYSDLRTTLRTPLRGKDLTIELQEGLTKTVSSAGAGALQGTYIGRPANLTVVFPSGFESFEGGPAFSTNPIKLVFAGNAPSFNNTDDIRFTTEASPNATVCVPKGASGFDVAPWTNDGVTIVESVSKAQVDAIRKAASDALDAIDLTVYREAEKTQALDIIAAAKAKLAVSYNETTINAAVDEANAAIAALKTDAELAEEDAAAVAALKVAVYGIPDELTLDDADAVDKALEAFKAMSHEQQEMVPASVIWRLMTAELAANSLRAEYAAAHDVANATVTLAKASAPYTGKAQQGAVQKVTIGETQLVEGTDYTVQAKSGTAAGSYEVTVTGTGAYTGTKTAAFKITQAANKVTAKKAKVSKSFTAAKKTGKMAANKSFQLKSTAKPAATFGAVTYAKTSGNKAITVSKTGKVTVKKGLKKGAYTVKVKASVAKTANWAAASKVITVKVTVK